MSRKLLAEYCSRLNSASQKLDTRRLGKGQARFKKLLVRVRDRLSRPPRLMLVGEFNSGKSLLANLLIGESVVPTSIVPSSQFPIRFHFAPRPVLGAVVAGRTQQNLGWSRLDALARLPVDRIDVGLPLERLRKFEIIDTPGMGSPSPLWNGADSECRLPFAHLPIWVTAAPRAWRESERRAWTDLGERHRATGLLVVTQTDLLSGPDDVARVLERLTAETAGLFASVIPLSLPEAIASSVIGKTAGQDEAKQDEAWAKSGGAQLEQAITLILEEIAARRLASAKSALLHAFLSGHLLGEGARQGAKDVAPGPTPWPDGLQGILPELDLGPPTSMEPLGRGASVTALESRAD
jgi:hypothetical protein